MRLNTTLLEAFQDELMKISESSFVRTGRRPISVERLLKREEENPVSPSEEIEGPLDKTSGVGSSLVLPAILGAGLYHVGRQANEDRKIGKLIRQQQQAQGQ